MKNKIYISLLFIIISFSSCEEFGEFFLGLDQQPEIIEGEFVPGFNILGILRPDTLGGQPASFIRAERVFPALGDTSSPVLIEDANIYVAPSSRPEDSIPFVFTSSDTSYNKQNYYPGNFYPMAGKEYKLVCRHAELPTLKATTRVPHEPKVANMKTQAGETIEFEILADTTAFYHEVYLLQNRQVVDSKNLIPQKGVPTFVSMQWPGNTLETWIEIYAYDKNMAVYSTSFNTSFNFNRYRPSISTVENGYGCFGSVNKTAIRFP